MVTKENLKNLFDKITVKLHNDGIGNIDVAYIDYEEPTPEDFSIKPVFVAFHDRDFSEYFKLAFMSELFEIKPTINNPLADPTLAGMEIYQTVKDYYVKWRREQSAGALWASQSKAARTYAQEDAKQTASLAKRTAPGQSDLSSIYTKAELDAEIDQKAFDKLAKSRGLGTPVHTSAPWEDPLAHEIKARDIHKQYDYMMSRRLHYIERAIEILKRKKHFTFFFTKFEAASIRMDEGSFNCKISLSNELPYIPHCSTVRHLDFDIPDRMFSHARHIFDDSVHIPADEKYLSEGHLILRIAYIIHQAAKLRETEKINNEVIHTHRVYHTDDPNTLRNLETYVI